MRMYRKNCGVEVEEVTINDIRNTFILDNYNMCPSSYGLPNDINCNISCRECCESSTQYLTGKLYKLTYDNDSFRFIDEDGLHDNFETRME